jgi:hypothetical protein
MEGTAAVLRCIIPETALGSVRQNTTAPFFLKEQQRRTITLRIFPLCQLPIPL